MPNITQSYKDVSCENTGRQKTIAEVTYANLAKFLDIAGGVTTLMSIFYNPSDKLLKQFAQALAAASGCVDYVNNSKNREKSMKEAAFGLNFIAFMCVAGPEAIVPQRYVAALLTVAKLLNRVSDVTSAYSSDTINKTHVQKEQERRQKGHYKNIPIRASL